MINGNTYLPAIVVVIIWIKNNRTDHIFKAIGTASNPYATELIFQTLGLLVHSTTRDAPYRHPSHDSILELWRIFPNDL